MALRLVAVPTKGGDIAAFLSRMNNPAVDGLNHAKLQQIFLDSEEARVEASTRCTGHNCYVESEYLEHGVEHLSLDGHDLAVTDSDDGCACGLLFCEGSIAVEH